MAEPAPPITRLTDGPHDRRGRPLRDLRLSVIDRCNFRCPYCMPEAQYPRDAQFLAQRDRLTAGEIGRLARLFVGHGVTKLRITGGEPLLRRDLPDVVRTLAALPAGDLALTTNGALLARQAQALRDAGLRRLTVSLDTVDPDVFRAMSGGRGELADVLAGIDAAECAGFARLKLNAMVMRGVNDAGLLDLVARFRGTSHVVRFIEYMDVGTCNGWDAAKVVPTAELVARIDARWPLRSAGRDYTGEVAERFVFADGGGEIGFVSSVSQPFCGDCHRARLSADGSLYTCLFAGKGFDLRGPMRAGASDTELAALIATVWRARDDRYSELRAARDADAPRRRIEMYQIGG